jgi:hypothetical protein
MAGGERKNLFCLCWEYLYNQKAFLVDHKRFIIMTNYAIIRSEKLKSENISKACGHNTRKINVENALPGAAFKNETLIHCGDYHQAVLNHVQKYAPNAQVRKTSVLAQEIVLSASAAYFRPDNPEKHGHYEQDLYEHWRDETFDFLKNRYGKNLISVEVHLDEATPHIHAVVVPITDDGRLSARDVFNKKELTNYHTDYAKACMTLGLERGVENSKAKHQKIQPFYEAVNSPTPQIPTVSQPSNKFLKKSHKTWAAEQNKNIEESVKGIHAKSTQVDFWKNRAEEEKAARLDMQSKMDDMKRQTASLKDLDLYQVMIALGYVQDAEKHQVDDKQNQFRQGIEHGKGYGDRISVNIDKGLWKDHTNDVGGKGSIDLVMHANSCTFKDAKTWLINEFGVDDARGAIFKKAAVEVDSDRKNEVKHAPPIPVPNNIEKVINYLINERKISPKSVEKLIKNDQLYADNRNNCCFVYGQPKSPVGVELRGTSGVKFNSFRGRKTATFKSIIDKKFEDITKIAVCESAIEALSYSELHPDHYAISISGTANKIIMKKLLDFSQENSKEIVIALNNDKAGKKASNPLKNACNDAEVEYSVNRPWGDSSDWNGNLKSVKNELEQDGIDLSNDNINAKQEEKVNQYEFLVNQKLENHRKNQHDQSRGLER